MNVEMSSPNDATLTPRRDDLSAQLEAIKAKLRVIEENLAIAR